MALHNRIKTSSESQIFQIENQIQSVVPDAISKLTPQEEINASVTVDKAPHISIGQLVTIDENISCYKNPEDTLNHINPIKVGTIDSIVYPGDYEIDCIAAFAANETGKYSIVDMFDRNISTEQLTKNNPKLKFAARIRVPNAIGLVNIIGWLDVDQIRIVKNRGGIVNEYAVKHR